MEIEDESEGDMYEEDGPLPAAGGTADELTPTARTKMLAEAELNNAPVIDKTSIRIQELADRIMFLENKVPDLEKTISLESVTLSKDLQRTTKHIMEA